MNSHSFLELTYIVAKNVKERPGQIDQRIPKCTELLKLSYLCILVHLNSYVAIRYAVYRRHKPCNMFTTIRIKGV